ncbi:MAG: 3-oxoacyl-[acyl-carrier-protein] synthase 2 [Chlamydiae bacterium]|nr:3-oxoacyl-[acyl-carrier-protein] synthase 2 [Chlamydiota bacterium]
MNKKRIVVTGMGLVSCFGSDVDTFYNSLLEGKSGIRPIDRVPCDEMTTRFAGDVQDFDPTPYVEKKQVRRLDPYALYAIVAGRRALENAGLVDEELEKLNKNKCGVLIGSGMGGMQVFYEGADALLNKGYQRITPFFVPYIITNIGGALLAKDVGFMGPNYSISTACATGNYSIINAANHIQQGHADVMVCGGAENAVLRLGIAGFIACKALSKRNDEPQKASRPWDIDRDGFVMGTGSGVLVLESLEHALARGATIYGEYLGGGISCDAHHITDPRADGLGVALCIENAIEDAGIKKEDINYINAHATSTPVGDMAEYNAVKKVFGDTSHIKMNATKSMIGHCLGAAGGIEAIASIKAIQTGMLHPTINLENPEPQLDMDVVPNVAIKHKVKAALSNSFGFGGHNASIIFGPYES